MVYENILRIKHLPKELSEEEKEEFLQHFGAIQVKIVNYKKEDVIAFAKFENAEVAKAAMFRLHQLAVLSSRLNVVYAENDIGDRKIKLKKIEEDDNFQKKCFKNFIVKMHSFNHSVGFHQPPPPHLRYEYPKANRPTVNNIAHVLATVPKFYVQVLHLMNRMNLPPPFVIENPPLKHMKPPVNVVQPKPVPVTQPDVENKSSSESEIESDGETKTRDVIPQKQSAVKKTIKRPKFIKPNAKQVIASKRLKSEEVFDQVDISVQKKIEVKVSGQMPERNVENDKISSVNDEVVEETPDIKEKGTVISDEELKSNQIPSDNLSVLAVFKDYHPGVPSNRLYIKNIAKNVTTEDLAYIFERYKSEPTGDQASLFEIKLMQEGRMKGQAFVTLDSVQIAQKAVEETNGFILKDKPLVVVYGRNAAQKPKS
ncbi:RNA-binding region-containing protein 3 [Coccinella septempunctata]|uniref:RNA-binding region-containing protein 3 n=1 Tax=Coccinella septempunctata TaxID=41139 RepID=UPI001D0667EC|nr:RNA-binding region-containing protein 3 [Coccinella septempunctata]